MLSIGKNRLNLSKKKTYLDKRGGKRKEQTSTKREGELTAWKTRVNNGISRKRKLKGKEKKMGKRRNEKEKESKRMESRIKEEASNHQENKREQVTRGHNTTV